jgi:hypothetical protein
MTALLTEELFVKFVDSDSFIIPYRLKELGQLLKSKQNITTNFANSLNTDMYNFLNNYFDLEYADQVTVGQVTRKLYGYKTGVYYIFMTFFVSYYYRSYYSIPHASVFLKYNIGLEEALVFWPNMVCKMLDIRKSIVNALETNQLISTIRKVDYYLIKEVDELIDVRKLLGLGSQEVLNKIAKYDQALAIAFVTQSLAYKILLDMDKKIDTLIGLDVYKNVD